MTKGVVLLMVEYCDKSIEVWENDPACPRGLLSYFHWMRNDYLERLKAYRR